MDQDRFWDIWTPRVLSVVRVAIAVMFMAHGTQKLFNFPSGGRGIVDLNSLPGAAGVIELVGGGLLLLGLGTRFVSFIMSGQMAYAYFFIHGPNGPLPIMNQGELAAVYSFVFLLFMFTGAGVWSLDYLLSRKPIPRLTEARWPTPPTKPAHGL